MLPVLPIILTGTVDDHRYRPALIVAGIAISFVCPAGFAVPMLAVECGSQAPRQRVCMISAHPVAVRWVSGLLLVAFGAVILSRGMLFAGM